MDLITEPFTADTNGYIFDISFCPLDKNYWAKDIIFLVTTGEKIGTQAWIDSYMGGHTPGAKILTVE